MSGEISSQIDLLDSDVLAIEEAVKPLQAKRGQRMHMESFRKEILDRFAEQGFKVDVKVWDTDQPGVYAFDIDIVARMEPQPFDVERMQHEVRNDLLGLDNGAKGLIVPDSAKRNRH